MFKDGLNRGELAWGCIIMAAIILLSVNVLSETQLRKGNFDLTENQLYTLTDGTREVLTSIDEPIRVRLYFSKTLGENVATFQRYFDRVRRLLERYSDIAGGKLLLEVFDPEPFSDAEDRAVASGLQGVPLSAGGSNVYFGVYASNSTDNEELIPFMTLEREKFLEYDLTKMIYSLANPEKNVVGVLSALPISGGMNQQRQQIPPWQVMTQIGEVYEVRQLQPNLDEIPEDVNLLMLVQPVGLTDNALFAIDQFALKGGKVLAFVDPISDALTRQVPGITGGQQETGIERLLTAWGIELAEGMVAGDIDHARRVQFSQAGQPVVVDYVAWLALGQGSLDEDDVVSGGIERLHVASAGILDPIKGAGTTFTPLLVTGPRAMRIEAAKFAGIPDPVKLLEEYAPGGAPLTLAARVTGPAKSAYPDGAPKPEEPETTPPTEEGAEDPAEKTETTETPEAEDTTPSVKDGNVNVVVFSDTDILHDSFWVQFQEFLGQQIAVPEANNADFVLNTLDNLTGGEALVGLRGRGVESRTFQLVEQIRRDADQQYRAREQALNAKLTELQGKLKNIEEKSDGGKVVLTADEEQAIETFRAEMIAVRQQLRAVKLALARDIDRLDTGLKLANIAAVPLLIGFGGLGVLAFRRRRRRGA